MTHPREVQIGQSIKDDARHLRAIIEAFDLGLVEMDASGEIVAVNDRWTQLTGLSLERSNRAALRAATHPDDRGIVQEWEQIRAERRSPYRLEFRLGRAPGVDAESPFVWLSLRGVLLLDEAGEIKGALAALQDVSNYTETREAMKHAERRWNSLWRNSAENMSILDIEGRILEMNRFAFGLPRERVIGAHATDFMSVRGAERFTRAMEDVLRTGDPTSYELSAEIDGEPSWWSSTLIPIIERGYVRQLLLLTQDVTLQRRSEIERIEAARSAGRAEVATNVIHNIGNVINGVATPASLLKRNLSKSRLPTLHDAIALLEDHRDDLAHYLSEDPKGRDLPDLFQAVADELTRAHHEATELVDALARNTAHVKTIIEAQQSYAKVREVQQRVTAVEVMEDALRICGAQRQWSRTDIVRDFPELPPFRTDKHRVLDILVNLVTNARHALDDADVDDRRIELSCALDESRGMLVMAVRDNGIGMDAETLERAFEHGFTTRRVGSGFGLHASANIAHELGGRLFASSEGPGRGALFTLELPYEPN